MKIESDVFYVSEDRGHSWEGPFLLPNFGHPVTARTCYHIEGPKRLRMYTSHKLPKTANTAYSDRALVIVTEDGGRNWDLVGEMTRDLPRSVMPDVVRLSDGTLVAALRRRLQYDAFDSEVLKDYTRMPWRDDNWIEIRRSTDDGRTWACPVRAAETAHGYGRNGNPPALAKLADDTLVLVYGYRGEVPAIKARASADKGYTFGEEQVLRDDARIHDLGYPRLVARPDGRCAAIYYFTTAERPENHIEATVFDPSRLM